MFAVVKTGGKQYRVAKDDVLKVEKLDCVKGEKILLTEVLMIVDGETQTVGAPMLEGAAIEAVVIDQGRARKIIVFKKKRRQNYRRKAGHRQDITILRVTDIIAKGAKPAAVKTAAPKAEAKSTTDATEAKPAKKAAAKKATVKKAAAKKPAAKK